MDPELHNLPHDKGVQTLDECRGHTDDTSGYHECVHSPRMLRRWRMCGRFTLTTNDYQAVADALDADLLAKRTVVK